LRILKSYFFENMLSALIVVGIVAALKALRREGDGIEA
jgi:hypothetical protein